MHSVPSDALGLEHFKDRVWPRGYVPNIRGLTTTFRKYYGVMEDDLQNGAFRTGYLGTLPRRFLGCIGLEGKGVDYGCLEPTEPRIA